MCKSLLIWAMPLVLMPVGLPIDAGLGYRYPALVGVFIVLIGFVAVSLYSKRESASLSKI